MTFWQRVWQTHRAVKPAIAFNDTGLDLAAKDEEAYKLLAQGKELDE